MSTSETAQKIAYSVCGEAPLEIEFLYDGASSRAWKITTPSTRFIVRVSLSDVDRPTTYQSELALFSQLEQIGVPVPKAITTYKDMPIDGIESPWAVTGLVDGQALESEPMTAEVASELGEALAKVHALPRTNYGRLEETSEKISGRQLSPGEGILARYCYGRLWPFDRSSLADNALYARFSKLDDRLRRHEKVISQIAEDRNVAIVHSDLHGKHIFVKGNRLVGIIDFGAAFIGVPEWEFGRLAFEFGWPTAKVTTRAYQAKTDFNVSSKRVCLVALVFALYKIDRYGREGSTETKLGKALGFLEETLELLETGTP